MGNNRGDLFSRRRLRGAFCGSAVTPGKNALRKRQRLNKSTGKGMLGFLDKRL